MTGNDIGTILIGVALIIHLIAHLAKEGKNEHK